MGPRLFVPAAGALLAALMIAGNLVVSIAAEVHAASWRLDPAFPVTADARTVHVLIWDEGPTCGYGPVQVSTSYLLGIIVIATTIDRGNCAVASGEREYAVSLDGPVGSRLLVDANGSYVALLLVAIGFLVPMAAWLGWRRIRTRGTGAP